MAASISPRLQIVWIPTSKPSTKDLADRPAVSRMFLDLQEDLPQGVVCPDVTTMILLVPLGLALQVSRDVITTTLPQELQVVWALPVFQAVIITTPLPVLQAYLDVTTTTPTLVPQVYLDVITTTPPPELPAYLGVTTTTPLRERQASLDVTITTLRLEAQVFPDVVTTTPPTTEPCRCFLTT